MTDSGESHATWCWRCRVEHLAWATECVHCGGELHSTPPPDASGAEFPASGSGSHGLLEIDLSGMDAGARDLFVLFLDGAGIPYELRGLLLSIAESDEERTRELLETITADTLVEFDPADSVSDTEWSRSMAAMMHPSAIGPPERIGESDTELTQVAGTVRRVVAAGIGQFVWGIAGSLILSVVYLVATADPPVVLSASVVFLPLVGDTWLTAVRGTTPGKYLLDMRVVDEWGSVPGWRSSIIRSVVLFWPLVASWLPGTAGTVASAVWLPWTVFLIVTIRMDSEHQGLHDRAAGTFVVDGRCPPTYGS